MSPTRSATSSMVAPTSASLATYTFYWTSPTSRQLTSRLHSMGYPHLSTTRSLNEGSSRLPSQMAPRTFKRASTAPTWLKRLYPLRLFLPQATFSTFGTKKAARILRYRVASGLPVAMASSPCILIFSNVTASTTAQRMCTLWIMTPSASLANIHMPHLPLSLSGALAQSLSPPPRLDKLNLKFGCYGLALPANTNLTCYLRTLLARHRSSNITPFDQSTSRSRPTSANRPRIVPLNVSLHAVWNSSWTSHSCARPRTITNAQTRLRIV